MIDNVEYPYPNRRLRGIIRVESKGKLLCLHEYAKLGWYEEVESRPGREPMRIPLRYYRCRKCGRTVLVHGPTDEACIEESLQRKQRRRRKA